MAFRRDTANAGDLIFVSGTLGDAGAALKHRIDNWSPEELADEDWLFLQHRLESPTPRNDLTAMLKGYVTAAIDISDGLLADLGHILNKSHQGAVIQLDKLPLSASLHKLPSEQAIQLALNSGDDYELCFTVPAVNADLLTPFFDQITCIGEITTDNRLILQDRTGQQIHIDSRKGYDHFGA